MFYNEINEAKLHCLYMKPPQYTNHKLKLNHIKNRQICQEFVAKSSGMASFPYNGIFIGVRLKYST